MSLLPTSAWSSIDWREPWFAPWQAVGEPALRAMSAGHSVAQALQATRAGRDHLPRFVASEALPPETPYETFVHDSGQVPSRDNLHDLFNGLAWCLYPQTKRRLNHWQAQAIARDGIGARRGPLRDAITLLDENGALLSAPDTLLQALRTRDWKALFIRHREDWHDARLWLFGHALVEKMVAPRKDITAHVLCAPPGLTTPPMVDAWLAETLDEPSLARKPFSPLPVLGVPGWAPSQDARFYEDERVFRAARKPELLPLSSISPQPSQGST
ncbi:DUF3025 domain-containing protein [Xylophilus sp. GOD-11R]|uniref:DUF3025 domain-containing protein n=1 Tax=Xylophilus sp. GOD-11R TaxID=3089814 RepID=UPI00298C56FB|nr:DUF3025 domain-containing protein [Xylophilus sp. GOD-11R]WPB57825.1 DUF3025 domain-containing protein [Xylophilus sp. GOD-11R]